MTNFAAFLSYVAIANASPGPNTIISMSNASREPLRRSIRFNLGIAAGVFAVLLLCSVFSLTVYRLIPAVQPVLVWIGAGYILWLAWKTLRSGPVGETEKDGGGRGLFRRGMVLQFVNPNTILYGITVFTTFIIPSYQSAPAMVLFSALLSIAAFVGTGCWTLFGAVFRKLTARYRRAVNVVMALLLAACAVSLVM